MILIPVMLYFDIDMLSDVLTDNQKKSKVGNILTKMRKLGKIRIDTERKWVLCEMKIK